MAVTPEMLARSGSESGHQKALFCWAALPEVRAKYPELKWMFAIPNGFFATPGQKAKMKAEGLKSGVPDICLPVPVWPLFGLYIELKVGKNKVKDGSKQDEWLLFLRSQHYSVAACHGWEQARDCIIRYLGVR